MQACNRQSGVHFSTATNCHHSHLLDQVGPVVALAHMADHALHPAPFHLLQALHGTENILLLAAAHHHVSTIADQLLGNAKPNST